MPTEKEVSVSVQELFDGFEKAIGRGRFEGEVLARLANIENAFSVRMPDYETRLRVVEQRTGQSNVQWEMLRGIAMILTSAATAALIKIVWH